MEAIKVQTRVLFDTLSPEQLHTLYDRVVENTAFPFTDFADDPLKWGAREFFYAQTRHLPGLRQYLRLDKILDIIADDQGYNAAQINAMYKVYLDEITAILGAASVAAILQEASTNSARLTTEAAQAAAAAAAEAATEAGRAAARATAAEAAVATIDLAIAHAEAATDLTPAARARADAFTAANIADHAAYIAAAAANRVNARAAEAGEYADDATYAVAGRNTAVSDIAANAAADSAAAAANARAARIAADAATAHFERTKVLYALLANAVAEAAAPVHPMIAAAPHRGALFFNSEFNTNAIDGEEFADGDEVVVLEARKYGNKHIFKVRPLSRWFSTNPPPRNPKTQAVLVAADIERYRISHSAANADGAIAGGPCLPQGDPSACSTIMGGKRKRSKVNTKRKQRSSSHRRVRKGSYRTKKSSR